MTIPSAFRRSSGLPRGLDWENTGFYLLPTGLVAGEQAAAAIVSGNGWPVAEAGLAFTAGAVIVREGRGAWLSLAPYAELVDWAEGEGEEMARRLGRLVRRIGARRAPWAGLALERPLVMGIVNTTPDSFSDGGRNLDSGTAVANALAMVEAGADIVDVGGESTRPGSAPVSRDEELARVLPVVRALAEKGVTVSIDTRHAAVMEAAMAAGAKIINDVTALEGDGSLAVAARTGAAVCIMHMQGQPQTMQDNPTYDCAPLDIYDYLAGRIAACEAASIPAARIATDPGIGFGKNPAHNAQVLASLALYHGLGCPILLGASRKRFVAALSKGEGATERLPGTLAAHLAGLDAGVQIIRAHDVPETVQAVKVWQAMKAGA
ncbi:MAG TPA: dihydropteroate synthase [Magnetospirillum sp.]|jgi:dihydropteroate synthase|nr:dihydropteroate synthase [Magnetospirillum sp.]